VSRAALQISEIFKEHTAWVAQGLENSLAGRDDRWSESLALGSRSFVEKIKDQLGVKAAHRGVIEADLSYALREPKEAYGLKFATETETLRSKNTFFWNENVDDAST
jgi:hypothetical protein